MDQETVSINANQKIIEISRNEDHELQISQDSIRDLKKLLSSCRLNFILGSGCSASEIPTLGNREQWFTFVDNASQKSSSSEKAIEDLLKLEYFVSVLAPAATMSPTQEHLDFANSIRSLLGNRGAVSIPKRSNVFTTNYDLLLEQAFDEDGIHYNDGFAGRISPVLSVETFSHAVIDQSLPLDHYSQIPSANLIKLHGSLDWLRMGDKRIEYVEGTDLAEEIRSKAGSLIVSNVTDKVQNIIKNNPTDSRLKNLAAIASGLTVKQKKDLASFSDEYNKLCIVNPTKRKFGETVLELVYYDFFRIYANELDKTNSLLVSIGFSFDDEHILEITRRALRNPRLILIIFCHTNDNLYEYMDKFPKLNNVWYVIPCDDIELGLGDAASIFSTVANNE